jgi:hypothetical protein
MLLFIEESLEWLTSMERVGEVWPEADTLVEGTGMGLCVIKQIIEAHDGRIEVQSKLGHGARFKIRLPPARSRAVAGQPARRRFGSLTWMSRAAMFTSF